MIGEAYQSILSTNGITDLAALQQRIENGFSQKNPISRLKTTMDHYDQTVSISLGISIHELKEWINNLNKEEEALALPTTLGVSINEPPDPSQLNRFIELSGQLPIDSFAKPLSLFKLQNILNRLPIEDTDKIQSPLESLINKATPQLNLAKEHSYMQLYRLHQGNIKALDEATQRLVKSIVDGTDQKNARAKSIVKQLERLINDIEVLEKTLDTGIQLIEQNRFKNAGEKQKFVEQMIDQQLPICIRNPLHHTLGPTINISNSINSNPNYLEEQLLPHLKLVKQKALNLKQREQDRLQKLANRKPVVFPRYFHATKNSEIAFSIAHTGVEAVKGLASFGAFVATTPELQFGSVVLGLPEMVQTSSTQYSHINKNYAGLNHDPKVIWSGLQQLITINPQEISLKNNLETALGIAIREGLRQSGISTQELYQLETSITHVLLDKFVQRHTNLSDGKKGWQLFYQDRYEELYTRETIPIHNIDEFRNRIKALITSSIHYSNVRLNEAFYNAFCETFLRHYQSNLLEEDKRADLAIIGELGRTHTRMYHCSR